MFVEPGYRSNTKRPKLKKSLGDEISNNFMTFPIATPQVVNDEGSDMESEDSDSTLSSTGYGPVGPLEAVVMASQKKE